MIIRMDYSLHKTIKDPVKIQILSRRTVHPASNPCDHFNTNYLDYLVSNLLEF